MRNLAVIVLGALAILTVDAFPSTADFITVVSDATTQGAITNDISRLSSGNALGLTFNPVIVGGQGSTITAPTGAPAGTLVVNIAPGDGENGFFRSTFTLPTAFSAISIAGAGNVDDEGAVFLNGHLISGALLNTSTELNNFGNRTFGTSIAADFVAGVNVLLVSDDNSGSGPSAASYYATITFTSAVPEPSSLAMVGCGIVGLLGWAARRGPRASSFRNA